MDQVAPRLQEPSTQDLKRIEEINALELTEEEIFKAKELKWEALEQEKRNKEYWLKLSQPAPAPIYTARQLREKLRMSKNALGKYFDIDKDNEAQVNALCIYFSGYHKALEYGIDPQKGILLMGGLGVGKSHLMSFFMHNQMSSYVMVSCPTIQNKWSTTDMKQDSPPDWIEYYSGTVPAAINANPYGHQKLGICFDDLGREEIPAKRFGEQKNLLAEILMNRYDRKLYYKLTHITTNLNGDQILEKYGDRLNDRLNEMFNVITFDENAKSRRQ